MHQIRYRATVKYVDFDNQSYSVSYEIFADDKDDARKITRELFFMSYGTYNDMQITVEPIIVPDKDKVSVNKILFSTYGVVKSKFINLNYKNFLKAFENFDGHNLILQPNYASFWFRFMNLECKAVWKNGESFISENEILLYLEDNRTYVIRDNLCNIYIAY